ncbi:MAG TPA: hypothetical protein ENN51_03650 [candidate division WOR-3 bacterium]|uniref:CobQ/CobB/MinD/ParA nucleotide binding domain-containing protein n=1 Tax=candidate division WOR-3 bacterium TaxID=2052148 RepID=A0A7V0XF27_UNCW3|nr:hypothetical protein [candidate division WOR-3 bacterium]
MKRPDVLRPGGATAPGKAVAGSGPAGRWVNAGELPAGLRRVCVFCGGFGSGKSEVAVNFAAVLAGAGHRVRLADLDIVNPYFRSREARVALRRLGVELLLPAEGLLNADMPVVPPEVRGALTSGDGILVIDLGGDPVGARVMVSIASDLPADELDGVFVLNARRPFTDTLEGAVKMMREIEAMAGFAITRVVANTHLADETDAAIVREGIELAEQVCTATGTELAFVAAMRGLRDGVEAVSAGRPLLLLERQLLKPWEGSEARSGEE